ncbi:hypothetical protein FB451DRAFT_1168522 [Mycena latifolia]|nr:hypothetical protein FB451DRAFT_1168522 [Mycena latifolia]
MWAPSSPVSYKTALHAAQWPMKTRKSNPIIHYTIFPQSHRIRPTCQNGVGRAYSGTRTALTDFDGTGIGSSDGDEERDDGGETHIGLRDVLRRSVSERPWAGEHKGRNRDSSLNAILLSKLECQGTILFSVLQYQFGYPLPVHRWPDLSPIFPLNHSRTPGNWYVHINDSLGGFPNTYGRYGFRAASVTRHSVLYVQRNRGRDPKAEWYRFVSDSELYMSRNHLFESRGSRHNKVRTRWREELVSVDLLGNAIAGALSLANYGLGGTFDSVASSPEFACTPLPFDSSLAR